MQKIIVGNWKMHGNAAMAHALALAVADAAGKTPGAEIILCPPAPLLSHVATCLIGTTIRLGAQDCAAQAEGAFTGDISAAILKDSGCSHIIVGHSERRRYHQETNAIVHAKAAAAQACGLIPIICIGETEAERDAGAAYEVVTQQIKECTGDLKPQFILAYEPVWAIGSGKTPTSDDIGKMHSAILAGLSKPVPVLYGGSVGAANAQAILATPGVSGVLVGGASIKAEEFCKIIKG